MKRKLLAVLCTVILIFPMPAAAAVSVPLNPAEEAAAARFCAAETRGKPLICQMGVAAALLNRLGDNRYPNTLTGILSAAGFTASPVKPSEYDSALWAVRCAARGLDPTGGATGWAPAGTAAAASLSPTLEAAGMVFGREP